MAILKTKKFGGEKDLVEFVVLEQILKENILTITQYGGYYTLFYYQ
ncbi:MAG: hypothetical protein ACXVJG_05985 [Mucilaginibacter sp.]